MLSIREFSWIKFGVLDTQRLEVIKTIYMSCHCRLLFLKHSLSILTIIPRKIHLNIIFSAPSQYSKRMDPHNTALRINTTYALFKLRIYLTCICWKHMFWKPTMTWSDKSHITHTATSPPPPLPTSRNKYPQLISVHQPMSVIESRPGAKWSLVNACQLDHPLAGLFAHSAYLMKGPYGYCRAYSVWKLRNAGISASA